MNRLCYIHSDASCLYKENILLSQASAVFNVCRYNNYIFKICKCLNNCSCQNNLFHVYVKNCSKKRSNNCKLKILSKTNTTILELGDIGPCLEKRIDFKLELGCHKEKIIVQLLVGNDVASTMCIIT